MQDHSTSFPFFPPSGNKIQCHKKIYDIGPNGKIRLRFCENWATTHEKGELRCYQHDPDRNFAQERRDRETRTPPRFPEKWLS